MAKPVHATMKIKDRAALGETRFRDYGGSPCDDLNKTLISQTAFSTWTKDMDAETRATQYQAAASAMADIAPRDSLEGMLAAQLVGIHHASMECLRRSMIHAQTFEGRREALSQANKLSRTYATLLEALNRHRGRGQQKVTVEHVHVHAGGQAIVGAVEHGGGVATGNQGQPHAKAITRNTGPVPFPSGTSQRSPASARRPSAMRSDRRTGSPWCGSRSAG
jgi:hypothetical protein